MQKPDCPMCGGKVGLSEIAFSGVSGSSSVLMGGVNKYIRYICGCNFDICSASVAVFNSAMERHKYFDRQIGTASGWRDALQRYNHYVDFITDNQALKEKLVALSDDEFNLRTDWSFLMDI
jgi:hypothetical protein